MGQRRPLKILSQGNTSKWPSFINQSVNHIYLSPCNKQNTLYDYDTIEEFNVDSKAEYTAYSSTRSQKLKQTNSAPLISTG